MTRYIVAAIASLLFSAPAAAQSVAGCSSVASNRFAMSKNVAKLSADATCPDQTGIIAATDAKIRHDRISTLKADEAPVSPAVELPKVASKLDKKALLVPTWGTGAIPPSAAPDVVGAFRFTCSAGPLGYFDPIVYPGLSTSHLHQFFGNTAVGPNSSYESLRTTGDSTCGNPLNRSAYWIPAMLNGKGGVVVPDYIGIYYKRLPKDSPLCQRQGKACVEIPRGLRYVFGFNMFDHTDAHTGSAYFSCDGPGAKPGHYKDIVEAAPNCPSGTRIGAVISAPDCWDGVNLDSLDHRSHIAYASYGSWGYLRCPETHPYIIPTFQLAAWYTVDNDLDRSGSWQPGKATWHISSDVMPGMAPARPGSTFHSDWFGAWDDDTIAAWTANCIDKMLNCSGGDLGNGKQMKGGWLGQERANPRVVRVPAH